MLQTRGNYMVELNNLISYVHHSDTYQEGEIIFLQGSVCHYVAYVETGSIAIRTSTSEGREFIIQTIGKHEYFGDVLILSGERIYLGNVVAMELTKLHLIEESNFLAMLSKCPDELSHYLKQLARKSYDFKQQVKLLSTSSLRDRILMYVRSRYLLEQSTVIQLKMTKEVWAALLNVQRPSLSRELKYMKQEGLIDYDRYTITLKTKGLEKD